MQVSLDFHYLSCQQVVWYWQGNCKMHIFVDQGRVCGAPYSETATCSSINYYAQTLDQGWIPFYWKLWVSASYEINELYHELLNRSWNLHLLFEDFNQLALWTFGSLAIVGWVHMVINWCLCSRFPWLEKVTAWLYGQFQIGSHRKVFSRLLSNKDVVFSKLRWHQLAWLYSFEAFVDTGTFISHGIDSTVELHGCLEFSKLINLFLKISHSYRISL